MRTQSHLKSVFYSPRSRLERECLPIGVYKGKNYNIAYFTLNLAYLYLHFDIQCFTAYFYPCLTGGKTCLVIPPL